MENRKAIVVGGGIAGLVSALELARAGMRVTLFERSSELGGRARSRSIDGYTFNQGPHALYVKGALLALLREHGVAPAGGSPALAEARALWDEASHPMPVGLGAILRLTPLGFGERFALLRAFAAVGGADHSAWRGKPFSAFLAQFGSRVSALIAAVARLSTYAHAPELLDAKAALDQMRLGMSGVIYVDDGWSRIVQSLETLATAASVEIVTEAPVAAITRMETGWRARFENRDPVEADAMILTAPPDVCLGLTDASEVLTRSARRVAPARAMSLDVGLRHLPKPEASFALGVDRPTYFSVHSQAGKLAPEGGALLHAARYLTPGEKGSKDDFKELERLVDLMQPSWRDQIADETRLIAMPVSQDIPAFSRQGRMAPIKLDDAPGLFLAGDWVGEGAMLSDAAAKSAREAARAAAAFLRDRRT